MKSDKNTISIILNCIAILLAIFFTFASQTFEFDSFYTKIGWVPSVVKTIFLFLAIGITIAPLGVSAIYYSIKSHKNKKQRDHLFECIKDMIIENLQTIVREKGGMRFELNIRIFTPHNYTFSKKTVFRLKNIKGFSSTDNTEGLEFEVKPITRGMVGFCYNKKQSVYEEDLHNTTQNYNLTKYQRTKTEEVRFCLCYPVFNKKDQICLIVSFDSRSVISIENCKIEWEALIRFFCLKLKENMPHLCR